MREFIKKHLKKRGFELRRVDTVVGRMDSTLKHLKARGLVCNNILDIGANRTKWSRLAQQFFPSSSFYLIEPQLEMESYLKHFCNDFENSCYFLAGAGSEKGNMTLTIWEDLQGSSFLPHENVELVQSGKQRLINILTVNDLIETGKMKVPDLVKLDIQGFELEALKGAEITFGKTEVYIIEVSLFPFDDLPDMPVFSDLVKFMLERNYVVYDFSGFLRRPFDGALGQCDICFVKKDGFLRKSNRWK